MAYGNFILDKGYDADAAITIYRAVKVGTSVEGVTPVTALSDEVLGIAQFGVTAGELALGKGCSVRLEGISEVEISAAIARGARVGIIADGRVRTAAAGDRVIGVALAAGTNAGDRIPVRLNLPGPIA